MFKSRTNKKGAVVNSRTECLKTKIINKQNKQEINVRKIYLRK